MMKSPYTFSTICGLMAGIAFLGTAAPGMAQGTDEDIIVTGRYGPVPDNAQSLSQTVSYADLDLSTQAGRHILKHRLSLTARYLCEKLGENESSSSVAPSCRDAAVKDAMDRVGTLEAHFAPRGTTWAAGPAWVAPYPGDWDKTYPE